MIKKNKKELSLLISMPSGVSASTYKLILSKKQIFGLALILIFFYGSIIFIFFFSSLPILNTPFTKL